MLFGIILVVILTASAFWLISRKKTKIDEANHKLDTTWLILAKGKPIQPELARTWAQRYNHILIYDEDGQPWLGLACREVLEDLKKGLYQREDYWIPFKGSGEAVSAPTLVINGLRFETYPTFLSPNDTDSTDWQIWWEIEKNFYDQWKAGYNYQKAFREM